MTHTKKQLEKLKVLELKDLIRRYQNADKDSGLTLSGNKGELIGKIMKYEKKNKPKKPKKSKKPKEQLVADAVGAALGVKPKKLVCKGLKKTKDPKCGDHYAGAGHCEWVVGTGCRDKPIYDDDVESDVEDDLVDAMGNLDIDVEDDLVDAMGNLDVEDDKPKPPEKSKSKPKPKPNKPGRAYKTSVLRSMKLSALKRVKDGPCGALQKSIGAKKLKELLGGKTCSKLTETQREILVKALVEAGLADDDRDDDSDSDSDSDSGGDEDREIQQCELLPTDEYGDNTMIINKSGDEIVLFRLTDALHEAKKLAELLLEESLEDGPLNDMIENLASTQEERRQKDMEDDEYNRLVRPGERAYYLQEKEEKRRARAKDLGVVDGAYISQEALQAICNAGNGDEFIAQIVKRLEAAMQEARGNLREKLRQGEESGEDEDPDGDDSDSSSEESEEEIYERLRRKKEKKEALREARRKKEEEDAEEARRKEEDRARAEDARRKEEEDARAAGEPGTINTDAIRAMVRRCLGGHEIDGSDSDSGSSSEEEEESGEESGREDLFEEEEEEEDDDSDSDSGGDDVEFQFASDDDEYDFQFHDEEDHMIV